MPKENTHLFFAERLLVNLADPQIRELLQEFSEAFFWGAVLPDAFFYHPEKDVQNISRRLHGIGDAPRNIITAFIVEAIRHRAPSDAVFAMGYLSHCVLDRLFHPVIEGLAGDYNDPVDGKRINAQYRHRLLETALDRKINGRCFMDQMMNRKALNELRSIHILSERTGVPLKRLCMAFLVQRLANGLFRRNWAYDIVRFLAGPVNRWPDTLLPLFYAHLNVDPCRFPEKVAVPDAETGKERAGGIDALMAVATHLAGQGMEAAHRFFIEGTTVSRIRLQTLIPDAF